MDRTHSWNPSDCQSHGPIIQKWGHDQPLLGAAAGRVLESAPYEGFNLDNFDSSTSLNRSANAKFHAAHVKESDSGSAIPHNARPLKQDPFGLFSDGYLVIMPFVFLGLLIATVLKNGKEIDASYSIYRNATVVASTLFPLVFAAVVGQSIKNIARFRLERGTTLGSLEQLMGSRTVFGALTTQVTMRHSTTLALCMILLWSLSPLGGQSAIRFITVGTENAVLQGLSVSYFDISKRSLLSLWSSPLSGSAGFVAQGPAIFSSLYTAALFSADNVKNSSEDTWGNVKIPTPQFSASTRSSTWLPVHGNVINYTSLVGIPVSAAPRTGHLNFTIQSSHIELQCGPISRFWEQSFELGNGSYRKQSDWVALHDVNLGRSIYDEQDIVPNGTFQGLNGHNTTEDSIWTLGLDTFVSPKYWMNHTWLLTKFPKGSELPRYPDSFIEFNETDVAANRATLLFQSRSYVFRNLSFSASRCSVEQIYVESMVDCTFASDKRRNCSVSAQRPSQKAHVSSNITVLSWPEVFAWVSNQAQATGQTNYASGGSDPALYYLNDTSLRSLTRVTSNPELWNMDPVVFSQRLGQLINTYLQLGQMFTSVADASGYYFVNNNITTPATLRTSREIYVISWAWTVVFMFAICTMLLVAIVGVVFRRRAIGPDILGYCSLAIRDSKYVETPLGVGTLDGCAMSGKMGKKRIRYGVVGEQDGCDGILGTAEAVNVRGVRRGARYL